MAEELETYVSTKSKPSGGLRQTPTVRWEKSNVAHVDMGTKMSILPDVSGTMQPMKAAIQPQISSPAPRASLPPETSPTAWWKVGWTWQVGRKCEYG
ncbi:MAG: hypothetical protein GY740_23655 [Gammaproteobacteria bacterium]|nr:hypothetical protein [Gammaproteobacteria bacterium]